MNICYPVKKIFLLIPLVLFTLPGITEARHITKLPLLANAQRVQPDSIPSLNHLKRPVPNPISDEIPNDYKRAVARHTRSESGDPGSGYWQQESDYKIDIKLLPRQKKLIAQSTVTYHNNSPDTLRRIYFQLPLNVDQKGAVRNLPQQFVNSGFHIRSFSYDGVSLYPANRYQSKDQPRYDINGTVMAVIPPRPLLPGQSVKMKTRFYFKIPKTGAGTGRIGYDADNLFFIAYFYPKVRVYDDVIGWFTDPFWGVSQFYNEFGSYDVNITVPPQWIVAATGQLTNAKAILSKPVFQRLIQAHHSDTVVHVVREKDFGHVTKSPDDGKLTWHYSAQKVNDFVFSVTKQSMWDAARAPIGDRNGDGKTDYTYINSFYRSSAPLWKYAAKFEQNAITNHAKVTGLPYPWPHMTAVEAGNIRGGGMEYPMMTLISPYKNGSKSGIYSVIAHELGHMWDPMQVATNERRYGWMDEGMASFLGSQARKNYYDQDATDVHKSMFSGYMRITDTDLEGPIMRWSDYQYNGFASGVASYAKPSSLMVVLRGLLGEETFNKAYHRYMREWQYKHPYPWDFFHTFDAVSGRDLSWFWRSWYYETWTLDQAVANVQQTSTGADILIKDNGNVPMPAEVQITLANGKNLTRHIDVHTWLEGATQKVLHVKTNSAVAKVVIDPEYKFPDADRSNNVWKKS